MRQSKRSSLSSKSIPPTSKTFLSPFVRRFIKRVQNTVQRYALWEAHQRFIVGVSGGADSLCLLDVLYLLSKKYHFALCIAHVNYGLRGKASESDERRVGILAKRYAIPCNILRLRKKKIGRSEEALRYMRYAFFEKLRKQKKYAAIVVAHNEDDQAETFLLRLLRGAGLSGLSAMRPKNGLVIRPFIETSRADILRYLRERHITYGTDVSNQDERYTRNRIRHTLLPLLEKKFQPQIKKLLAHTARLLAEDAVWLEKIHSSMIEKSFPLRRAQLLALPETTLRQLLRALLKKTRKDKNPSLGIVEEIIKTLKSAKSKIQTVRCKGLRFIMKGDRVRLLYK